MESFFPLISVLKEIVSGIVRCCGENEIVVGRETNTSYNRPCRGGSTSGGCCGSGGSSKSCVDGISLLKRI